MSEWNRRILRGEARLARAAGAAEAEYLAARGPASPDARRAAFARCRAGTADDADRLALATPSADGRRMLGPAECMRCAKHPRRRETFRWVWPVGSTPEDGDCEIPRGCAECDAEAPL